MRICYECRKFYDDRQIICEKCGNEMESINLGTYMEASSKMLLSDRYDEIFAPQNEFGLVDFAALKAMKKHAKDILWNFMVQTNRDLLDFNEKEELLNYTIKDIKKEFEKVTDEEIKEVKKHFDKIKYLL